MNSQRSLSILSRKKTTIWTEINHSKNVIASVDEKINRLEIALHKLNEYIHELNKIKINVNSYELIDIKWKGERKRNFEKYLHFYKNSLKRYFSDVEKSQNLIKESLAMARKEKYYALNELTSVA